MHRERSVRLASAVLVAAMVCHGATAHADLKSEAFEHFKKGNSEFDLGHFKIAAREFEQSYKLQQQYKNPPEHTLLFNIGQAYRLAGDYPSAQHAYQVFIKREPSSPERAHVEQLVAKLDKAIKSGEAAIAARPHGTIPQGGSRASDSSANVGGGEDFGKRILVLATEQNGPTELRGWTDIVFGPGGGGSNTTVIRTVNELGGVEATLADELTNGGFEVIDPSVLRGRLMPKPPVEMLSLGGDAARDIALRSDADLVIIVKAVGQVTTHAQLGSMYSGQSNVVARVVRVSDGKVLAAATQHAAQVHIDADTARNNALIEAARETGRTLIQKLTNL